MRPRSRPAAARTPGTAAAHPPAGPGRALEAMAPATRQQPACLPPGEADLAESASERLRLRAVDFARSLLRDGGLKGGRPPRASTVLIQLDAQPHASAASWPCAAGCRLAGVDANR